jgi:nitronate monooxygenase
MINLLKIKYPIIQAPMLGVTTPEMVAAVSNEGGLGSLPVGGLSPEITLELIRKTKSLTNNPFAVNLFAHKNPPLDIPQIEAMKKFLKKLCDENKLPYQPPEISSLKFNSYTDQISVLLDENIPIVSFTFGILNDESIKQLQNKGTVLIGTATCLKEAMIQDEKGIDVIVAQGIEAGGHRGTFLEDEPLPMVGLMSLVPQIVQHIKKPVVAAGGINDGRTIKSAFLLGAQAVQAGTAFITSHESLAIPAYKQALQHATDTDAVLTKAFSGRWLRGIKNKFVIAVEQSGLEIPAYPIQGGLIAAIRAAAQQENNKEFSGLLAGQSSFKCEEKSSAEIFRKLLTEAEFM